MKLEKGTVKVTFGSGDTERTVERETSYQHLETAEDVLTVISEPKGLEKLLKDANYGANLNARSAVRQAIQAADAGPEKAIEKAVADANKARAANGKPEMTAEQLVAFKLMLQ